MVVKEKKLGRGTNQIQSISITSRVRGQCARVHETTRVAGEHSWIRMRRGLSGVLLRSTLNVQSAFLVPAMEHVGEAAAIRSEVAIRCIISKRRATCLPNGQGQMRYVSTDTLAERSEPYLESILLRQEIAPIQSKPWDRRHFATFRQVEVVHHPRSAFVLLIPHINTIPLRQYTQPTSEIQAN